MQTPLEIAFNNMDPSDFVEARVREKAAHLEHLCEHITSCRVYINAAQKRHRKGNRYEVHIDVHLPGHELNVNNMPGDRHAHEDVYVAIRDAFKAMERQIMKWKEQAKGKVKVHEMPLQGRITELHTGEGFGQIATTDGRLVYFHKNSVVGKNFDDLNTKDTVELVIQYDESEKGPQASTVRQISSMKFKDTP